MIFFFAKWLAGKKCKPKAGQTFVWFEVVNSFYIATFGFTSEMSETEDVHSKEMFPKDAERFLEEFLNLSENEALNMLGHVIEAIKER